MARQYYHIFVYPAMPFSSASHTGTLVHEIESPLHFQIDQDALLLLLLLLLDIVLSA